MKRSFLLFLVFFSVCFAGSAHAFTREMVEERGVVRCGVSTGTPGFSSVDGKGNWWGMDVDVCRAVAAAVFNDASKVTYIPLLPKERTTALISGDIDILSRNYAWNLTRDSALSLNFAAVTVYDMQEFLTTVKNGGKSVRDMSDFSVCLQSGTVYGGNLSQYLPQGVHYRTVESETPDQVIKDFEAGRCEVITGSRAILEGLRQSMRAPQDTVFLDDKVALLAMGPAVRHGDDGWFDIVKWSVFAMISAEEIGISSKNIDEMVGSSDPAVSHFLGLSGIGGKGLGLPDGWAYQIIKQVGNYQEVFDRNLGAQSPLKQDRGLNRLWNKGGILFAPPMQ